MKEREGRLVKVKAMSGQCRIARWSRDSPGHCHTDGLVRWRGWVARRVVGSPTFATLAVPP